MPTDLESGAASSSQADERSAVDVRSEPTGSDTTATLEKAR